MCILLLLLMGTLWVRTPLRSIWYFWVLH